MNPSVQDRLDSCVRALEHVVLPALPETASLAREQVMLVMGQVQIIRAQLDATPAFEQEEAADLAAMAQAMCDLAGEEADALRSLLAAPDQNIPRDHTAQLQDGIDALLQEYEGNGGVPSDISAVVCEHGAIRAQKDRAWFAAMGFDAGFAA
ncbi:MAG: hypothetical protein AAGL68_03630 [Pseudomonadota bacterium]